MSDDSTLLCQYATSHDEAAFHELVRRHLPLVYSSALRRCLGDTHRAEEIAQIVFTDLACKAKRLTSHPSLVGWLHTSTRYATAAVFRGEQRRRFRETQAFAMQENASSSEPPLDWGQLKPVIDSALDQLSERDRQMLLLRFFENQSFASIGEAFHLSENTAQKRANRALDKLRLHLSRRGITSTSVALGLTISQQAIASVAVPAGLAASVASGALVSVATVAVTSTGGVSLMTIAQTKLGIAALACVTLAVTVETTVLARKTSEQKRVIAVLSNQVAKGFGAPQFDDQIADAEQMLNDTLRRSREVEAKLAALPPPRRHAPVSATAVRSGKVALLLAKDPEYVRLVRQRTRAWITQSYGEFFAELNLPKGQLDALKEILLTDAVETRLAREAAHAAGEATATDEVKAALRTSTDAAIRSLLGDAAVGAFRRAETRFNGGAGRVNAFILADLAEGGHPLTDDQEKRLAPLLYDHLRAANSSDPTANGSLTAPILSTGLTAAETAVIAEMGEELTPVQRALLAEHFKFEHERAALEQRIAAKLPQS